MNETALEKKKYERQEMNQNERGQKKNENKRGYKRRIREE